MINQHPFPKLPLPEPLIAARDGAFTEFTVTQRMPGIARRVINDNNFPVDINQSLEQLAQDLVSGYIQVLSDDTGVDVPAWQKYLEPYHQQRWLDVPWFFAETYFYRYILNLTNYFRPGNFYLCDPFAGQKQQGLVASFDAIIKLCQQVNQCLESSKLESSKKQTETRESALTTLFYFDLWGNRVDLSLWPALQIGTTPDVNQKLLRDTPKESLRERSQFDVEFLQANILVNNVNQVVNLLLNQQPINRVDFVIDNAGFELVCDLCLVDFILGSGLANQVQLNLKPHPTFVSDAMIVDVQQTINYLAKTENWDVTYFAHRLQEYLDLGRLVLVDNYFWTSPLAFWQLPEPLNQDLAASSLIVIKGDANYRRLLDDRKWNYSTDIADIICYLPAPSVALRTLKSEVAAGIEPAVVKNVQANDENWLTNGQWGLIQFVQ